MSEFPMIFKTKDSDFFGLTLFYENPDRQRSRTINAHQRSLTFTYMIVERASHKN